MSFGWSRDRWEEYLFDRVGQPLANAVVYQAKGKTIAKVWSEQRERFKRIAQKNAGVADMEIIQAAINYVYNKYGSGVVKLSPQEFLSLNVSQGLILYKGVSLVGSVSKGYSDVDKPEYGTRIRFWASEAKDIPVLTLESGHGAEVRDIFFKAHNRYQGILIKARFAKIVNVSINRTTSYGVKLLGDGSLCAENHLENVGVYNPDEYIDGFVFQGTDGGYATQNTLINCHAFVKGGGTDNYGFNFVANGDSNYLIRCRAGGIGGNLPAGVIFNSGNPTADNGVYGNVIIALNCENGSNPQVIVNKTEANAAPNYIIGVKYVASGESSVRIKIQNNGRAIVVGAYGWLTIPTTEPLDPVAGCMYFDTSTGELKIYDGSAWKSVSLS